MPISITLAAFGFSRLEIMGLFLVESFLYGLIGILFGALLGYLVVQLTWFLGIPFTPPGSEFAIYIRPVLHVNKSIFICLTVLLSTLIGGIFPAYWGSKIHPTEALRYV